MEAIAPQGGSPRRPKASLRLARRIAKNRLNSVVRLLKHFGSTDDLRVVEQTIWMIAGPARDAALGRERET